MPFLGNARIFVGKVGLGCACVCVLLFFKKEKKGENRVQKEFRQGNRDRGNICNLIHKD